MTPFQIFMGDDAEAQAETLRDVQQSMHEARREVQISLGEARELRTLIGRVERDIDLWDVRAGTLNRLCRLSVALSAIVGLTEIAWLAGHLIR